MPRHLHSGPGYLLQGLQLMTHPRLRWFVLGPLLINLLLFIGLSWLAVTQFGQLLDSLMARIPEALRFLAWIFWILFAAFLLLVYGYSFAIIGNLLASPFYGPLAERAEEVLSGRVNDTSMTTQQLLALAGRAMQRELIKMGYFLPRIVGVLLLTLVLSLIPVVNLIGPAIAFLWGAWSLALQHLDYPADNHQMDFRNLRETMAKRRLVSLSFGGSVLIATTIPLFNLFAMPASVIGASSFWLERIDKPAPQSN